MDIADDPQSKYLAFGMQLQRDTVPKRLEPILGFIAWSKLSLERGTKEPLLVFTKNALAFTRKRQYAVAILRSAAV